MRGGRKHRGRAPAGLEDYKDLISMRFWFGAPVRRNDARIHVFATGDRRREDRAAAQARCGRPYGGGRKMEPARRCMTSRAS